MLHYRRRLQAPLPLGVIVVCTLVSLVCTGCKKAPPPPPVHRATVPNAAMPHDRKFLIRREELVPARSAFTISADARNTEQAALLENLDYAIRDLIVDEMSAAAPSGRVQTGTAFVFGADPDAAGRVAPERRAWVFSCSLEEKLFMDGLSGFLSDRAIEVDGAVEALETLGCPTEAAALRTASLVYEEWSRESYVQRKSSSPQEESAEQRARSEALQHAGSLLEELRWRELRIRLALAHEELFFDK